MTKKKPSCGAVTDEPYIKWSKAIASVQREWPSLSVGALYTALRAGKIPHRRTSDAKKARISVRLSDLKHYIGELTRPATN